MARAGRRADEGPGARAHELVAERELDLSFEDVERVDVVVVDVRVDGAEPGLAVELERLELGALVPDVELAARPGEQLALAGAEQHSAGRPSLLRVPHVEALGIDVLAAVDARGCTP